MNLRLLQLGDSALPVGGYTHSWGLEAALSRGLVRDAESLERWVRAWLRHAVGPLEGVTVAACCRAALAGDLEEGRRGNAPLAARPGRWGAEAVPRLPAAAWHHAAAFGFLAAVAGASPRDAVLVYLHQAA